MELPHQNGSEIPNQLRNCLRAVAGTEERHRKAKETEGKDEEIQRVSLLEFFVFKTLIGAF